MTAGGDKRQDEARAKRLAEALRANLKRRKAQAKSRQAPTKTATPSARDRKG